MSNPPDDRTVPPDIAAAAQRRRWWGLPRTLKGFILGAALLVTGLLFGLMYLGISAVYDRTVREDARTVSEVIAQQTFSSMFQVMRKGWTRAELEEFIAATRASFADTPYTLEIYRGERVEALFGPIVQPLPDPAVKRVFATGEPVRQEEPEAMRHVFPLRARAECLACHSNAVTGDVLGVIDVRENLVPVLERARGNFLRTLAFIAPLPLVVAFLVALYINRRLTRSVDSLRGNVERIHRVADLDTLRADQRPTGFSEFDSVLDEVNTLAAKLNGFAVDKGLLEFEIRLLERFVITSDVVRDWSEYVSQLLREINRVLETYTLFSVFKVDDELFDLDVFWYATPSEETRALVDAAIERILSESPVFGPGVSTQIAHHVADTSRAPLNLTSEDIEMQTKSLVVEAPKIGGIVGIGVQSALAHDQTRLLVMDSILSTLLNVVGSVRAISKYTKDLEHYATRDPLTGLYNQRVFWELLGYEIVRAERHRHQFGLMVIDLDNFKQVNDGYGHTFGDRFLQAFADAVKAELRKGDIFARYGGDEFVVMVTETDDKLPYTAAERILKTVDRIALEADDGMRVRATVSIGVAVFPEHADNAKDLFLFADNMMYRAKSEGKNRLVLPTEADVVATFRAIGEKSALVNQAIEERWIEPYFQPIVASADGRNAAHEVLSRIHLPNGDIMGAAEFVEIAERLGVIHKLDYIAMEKAFRKAQEEGYMGLLFVNISPKALVLNEFFQTVKQFATDYAIDPARVVFELTERDTVQNVALLETFVARLRMDGFQFAVDDFGSGFSSFHYIKRFPIDFIKIEGEFIANMLDDARDRAFVHSISRLAADLEIRTIAEFVENEAVLSAVRECGIDFAQGYHLGRPAAEFRMNAGDNRRVGP